MSWVSRLHLRPRVFDRALSLTKPTTGPGAVGDGPRGEGGQGGGGGLESPGEPPFYTSRPSPAAWQAGRGVEGGEKRGDKPAAVLYDRWRRQGSLHQPRPRPQVQAQVGISTRQFHRQDRRWRRPCTYLHIGPR